MSCRSCSFWSCWNTLLRIISNTFSAGFTWGSARTGELASGAFFCKLIFAKFYTGASCQWDSSKFQSGTGYQRDSSRFYAGTDYQRDSSKFQLGASYQRDSSRFYSGASFRWDSSKFYPSTSYQRSFNSAAVPCRNHQKRLSPVTGASFPAPGRAPISCQSLRLALTGSNMKLCGSS